jgi:hypothetical protein
MQKKWKIWFYRSVKGEEEELGRSVGFLSARVIVREGVCCLYAHSLSTSKSPLAPLSFQLLSFILQLLSASYIPEHLPSSLYTLALSFIRSSYFLFLGLWKELVHKTPLCLLT